jgi:hypothetical protein
MDEKPKRRLVNFSMKRLFGSIACLAVAAAIASNWPDESKYDFDSIGQSISYSSRTASLTFCLSPFVGAGIGLLFGRAWCFVGTLIGIIWLPLSIMAVLLYAMLWHS